MKIYFYEKKITLKTFFLELGNLQLEAHEEEYIIKTAKSAIFHKIIDFCLCELQDDHKNDFISKIHKKEDDIFEFLEEKIENFNEKFLQNAEKFEKEVIELLK